MKCIKCQRDINIDISNALDEDAEVFKCPHCGFIFRYADK